MSPKLWVGWHVGTVDKTAWLFLKHLLNVINKLNALNRREGSRDSIHTHIHHNSLFLEWVRISANVVTKDVMRTKRSFCRQRSRPMFGSVAQLLCKMMSSSPDSVRWTLYASSTQSSWNSYQGISIASHRDEAKKWWELLPRTYS